MTQNTEDAFKIVEIISQNMFNEQESKDRLNDLVRYKDVVVQHFAELIQGILEKNKELHKQ